LATATATRQVIVQDDGSVTIPRDVLDRAGIKPGDELHFWSTGQGNLSAVMLPKLTIDELFERYGDATVTEIDWKQIDADIEEAIAQDVIDEMRRNG
jgi:bifunctional DNA-binding transcriptional regulator/antitoxin component of YhaV-PrlF toxin-antitoxin module